MKRPETGYGMRHVALFVRDLNACEEFYTRLLGFEVEYLDDGDLPPEFSQLAVGERLETMAGQLMAALFFEPSTRTRSSCSCAGCVPRHCPRNGRGPFPRST